MCLVIAAISGFEQTIVNMRTKIHLEKWVSQAAGGEPDFKSTLSAYCRTSSYGAGLAESIPPDPTERKSVELVYLPCCTAVSLDCICCFLSVNTVCVHYKDHKMN